MKKDIILLGRGVLNWPRDERVSDRYGLVKLSATAGGYASINDIPETAACAYDALDYHQAGIIGTLFAVVLETRQSHHIGDMFRGFSPSTPEVGERIKLGTGILFYEFSHDSLGVGIRPLKPRNKDWLNPRKLYRCHDQTVELQFEPAISKT